MNRSGLLGLLLLLAAAGPAAAQLPAIFPATSRWMDPWYPALYWTPRDGFTAGGYYSITLPLSYEDFLNPAPHKVSFSIRGRASTSGSRKLELKAWAPALLNGWRFRLDLAAERGNRENYFGVGNTSTIDDANVTDTQEFFYRARHLSSLARGEIQRRVFGGLRLLVGWHAERWRLDTLQSASQLGLDLASGANPTVGIGTNDIVLRFGAVFDTRNDEPAPDQGVLLELIHGIADADIAGDLTYTRTTFGARGYLPLGEFWRLAARVAGQTMGGTPPLGSYYMLEASDSPAEGIGGPESHRGLYRQRLLGQDKLLANVEVKYLLLPLPRVVAFGFVDAGRVFDPTENEEFRITTDGMKVGGGAGLMLQLARDGFLGWTLAGGPDGLVLHAMTRWTF